MGNYLQDCVDLLGFSMSWIRDTSTRNLLFILFALIAVGGTLFFAITAAVPVLLLLYLPAIVLVFLYFSMQVFFPALRAKGLGNAAYGPVKFAKLLAMSLISMITVLLPWMEIRLLAANVVLAIVAVIGIILSIKSTAGIVLFVLGALLLGLSVIYSSMRLLFAYPIYLSGKTGVFGAMQTSWKTTNGKITQIFVRHYLVSGFIQGGLYAAIAPFYLVGVMLSVLLMAAGPIGGLGILLVIAIVFCVLMPVALFLHTYLLVGLYSLFSSQEPPLMAVREQIEKPTEKVEAPIEKAPETAYEPKKGPGARKSQKQETRKP